jgi:hypothetical protein
MVSLKRTIYIAEWILALYGLAVAYHSLGLSWPQTTAMALFVFIWFEYMMPYFGPMGQMRTKSREHNVNLNAICHDRRRNVHSS